MNTLLKIEKLAKSFTLHTQGGVRIQALLDLDLKVAAGECLALVGGSGAGKSSLLRCLTGNYLPDCGSIQVRREDNWVELVGASPQTVLELRRATIGYVSQFLRVIPRVPALDLVIEPAVAAGTEADEAEVRARDVLRHLNLPERLWSLAPATFSGGEQQRVNIARAFVHPYPILLLDEPTASLDARNRKAVIDLIEDARRKGAAIVGIFHDAETRTALATREIPLVEGKAAA
ncbi:phosphonate C-P lyase system protein PhnL [Algihabitans albus]|uniref:phosphonate C-P lyase system protein PhnL n=1 Tax=Algihabitans albus TaxID=2164067 RepID=UPI000E5CF885|nr:phosphonate C-P lyase system protein PhnL [Algihabitans albus]